MRALHQYAPSQVTIQEEPQDETIQQQQRQQVADDSQDEYVIRRQMLGELVPSTPVDTTTEIHQPPKYVRGHSGSRSTLTTEFSRQFQFVDAAEAGAEAGGVHIHSAWSQEAMKKHRESRADHVLVETLLLHEAQDELEQLRQGADALTSDAFDVATGRVTRAEVPLTQAATRAAQVICLDILNRALRDKLRHLAASYAGRPRYVHGNPIPIHNGNPMAMNLFPSSFQ